MDSYDDSVRFEIGSRIRSVREDAGIRDYENLDAKRLQKILPVGKDTIYKMLKLEDFPSVRLGNRYVVRRDKFEAWWEENEGREIVL